MTEDFYELCMKKDERPESDIGFSTLISTHPGKCVQTLEHIPNCIPRAKTYHIISFQNMSCMLDTEDLWIDIYWGQRTICQSNQSVASFSISLESEVSTDVSDL